MDGNLSPAGVARRCWTCRFRITGGVIFPVACAWWIDTGRAEHYREVPARVVDTGCKHHEPGEPYKKKAAAPEDKSGATAGKQQGLF